MMVRATNAKGILIEISEKEYLALPPLKRKLYKRVPHGYYVHMNEDAEAHAIIGGNKQGKSSLVKELLATGYEKKFNKIIVLNASAPQAFADYKFTDNLDKLKTDWRGIVRYHKQDGGYKKILNDIYQLVVDGYIYNGAIVFDDCSKYIDPWPSEDIRAFLVDRRMYGLDLYFTTHALRFLPRFCRGMVNTVTTFKTAEVFKTADKIMQMDYSNYEGLFAAWNNAKNTPHDPKKYIQYHEMIETGI